MLYRAYYPLEDAPDGRLPVARELALAIMRRESEFDTAAQSHAGAQGLMQVMPGTAKLVARKLGLPYKPAHLISDPDYNMTIGAHYLAGLMDEFGPSTLLVTSGYNAGPGRPRSWMQTLGDPRVPGVDPVDWIEHVPFTETRNYIMRVTESMMIYRARMAGRPVPLNMVDLLKGR
jgi:soluble lytic murein transglycosylase